MPLLRGMFAAGKRCGLRADRVLAELDLADDALDDADCRVPRAALYRAWDKLGDSSGDQALGIHVAEAAEPGDFAVLDYAMRNSPTLGAAYRQMTRYSHVLHDGVDIVLDIDGDVATLCYHEPSGSPRQLAEWAVAQWLVLGRQITGAEWIPQAVRFQHAEPDDVAEHRRLFRCSIEFGAADNRLSFDASLLSRQAVRADPNLFTVVSSYARQLLDNLPKSSTTTDRVRQVLAGMIGTEEASLESVGSKLGMARRTLQRKLKAEDRTFQQVLDDVRCDLAKKYLAGTGIAVEETAFLVGFSEPSGFNRAFKRWTGSTPSEYRTSARAS